MATSSGSDGPPHFFTVTLFSEKPIILDFMTPVAGDNELRSSLKAGVLVPWNLVERIGPNHLISLSLT